MRALVVGSGSIARRHITNLRELWPDGQVACVSASGRELMPNETSAGCVLRDMREALDWRPDLAVIASPAPFHLAQAAGLAERHVPVLIEKPLTHSLVEFDRWAPVLEPHAGRIDVAYNLRFLPSAQLFKQHVDAGTVGRITNLLVDVGQYLPDWRPQADYRTVVSARRELGGGALLELSHEFDYLRWIFGEFVTGFCAATPTGSLAIDVEDRADIVLASAEGLVANVHLDFLQRRPRRTCRAIGEWGTLVWDAMANSITLEVKDGVRSIFAEPDADRNIMYLDQLRRFASFAIGEVAPTVGLAHARDTLRLVERLKISAATGRSVVIAGDAS